MQIKEIIIDGFKSYKSKVHIGQFDKYFNAITGLNGSGKSNIFDAICFVMGISSLSHMRASNLQELIFQNGKAEVKKANVSIIFTNSSNILDLGDEIIVTRTIYESKSKFLINGKNSTQKDIQNLFLSAGLNINNPHFLIMQGKVMKVVNMSGVDILGLLEEASGTSIYENKKDSSIKMINKKENKLIEVDRLLNEYVSPKLKQLNSDRVNYLKWKDMENKIYRLYKLITAYDYVHYISNLEQEKNEKKTIENMVVGIQLSRKKNDEKLKSLDKDLNGLKDKVNVDLSNEVFRIENEIREISVKLKGKQKEIKQVKENKDKYSIEKSEMQMKINKLNNERLILEKKNTILNTDLIEVERNIEERKQTLLQYEIEIDGKTEYQSSNMNENVILNNILKSIQENELLTKKLNMENEQIGNQEKSAHQKIDYLVNMIKRHEEGISNISINKKDIENEMIHINQQLKYYENLLYQTLNMKEVNKEKKGGKTSLGSSSAELEMIIKNRKNEIKDCLSQCKQEIDVLSNSLRDIFMSNRGLSLSYEDPEINFDKRKVKGRVMSLFSVKESKFYRALEKIAGGRLFNIVVDSNLTSTLLFQRRSFKDKETLLPMNQIQVWDIDKSKKEEIKKKYGDTALLITDLLSYNQEYDKIMKYVFGTSFLCTNNDTAKSIAYGPYKIKCVNLDGDIYDPSGNLSGGSKDNSHSLLEKFEEIRRKQERIDEINVKVGVLNKDYSEIDEKYRLYHDLLVKYNERNKEIDGFSEEKLKDSIDKLKSEREVLEEELILFNTRKKEIFERLKENQKKEANLKKEEIEMRQVKGKDKKKIIKEKIEKIKNEIIKEERVMIDNQNKINQGKATIQKIDNDIKRLNDELVIEDKEINRLEKEILDGEIVIEEWEKQGKGYEKDLQIKRKEEVKGIEVMKKLIEAKEVIDKENEDLANESYAYQIRIDEISKNSKEIQRKVNEMIKENDWIESEKTLFGNKGSDYDFDKVEIGNKKKEYKNMKEENGLLEKRINFKVDILVNEFEKQYNDLIEKRQILINDKQKMEKAINELDIKRKESIQKVYDYVNIKLNSIYSTFLPGAMAQLILSDKTNILKGLEMRVGFNGSWKNSLSELSGGQRSLLALSFILALLCNNPAPFYILDEVDAALDLSHTSNLGLMIKEHFPQSQFIIISLKDGMFTNANVLFKVSYVDGTSKVTRHVKELKNIGKVSL